MEDPYRPQQPASNHHHDIKHSMKRRSTWHDYCHRGLYMLTLEVQDRQPLLGILVCDDHGPHINLSTLGRTIVADELPKISRFYPMVEVWRICMMPDHIHMIVRVKEDMPAGHHLGQVVRGFKTGCSRAWWNLGGGEAPRTETHRLGTSPVGSTARESAHVHGGVTVASASPEASSDAGHSQRLVLFAPGYNDRILLQAGQLDRWKAYLDDNPRRLWVKRQNPQLFTVMSQMEIAGHRCQCVGNRFLLDVPDKVAVIYHRRYSEEELSRLRVEWLTCGERGGVLVSAAIHSIERAVIRMAKERGYRVIDLMENGFPPLYKPIGEDFDACAEGRLLQISPWEYHMERHIITRAQCLELNAMAEAIAREE